MLRRIVGSVLEVATRMREDVEAACANDPAARGPLEVALLYPGVHAVWAHRVAHALWSGGHRFLGRAVSQASRSLTGVEIHPGARIGRGVFIDHGMGVVIGETASVGDRTLIYKGVVLGGTSLEQKIRHPQIGRDVVIGSNACVLGAIEVGDGARVGSGSVVVRAVPAGATVVGVPARVVPPKADRASRLRSALDHANLPDPVSDLLRALALQNERLIRRLEIVEARLGVEREPEPGAHDPFDPLPPLEGG